MKKLTHPKLTQTLMQLKDGSIYFKRWLFFKPILSLEIDYLVHQYWSKQKNTTNMNISMDNKYSNPTKS